MQYNDKLSPGQIWQLGQIVRGKGTLANLRTWDNRKLAGLHRREMFYLDSHCTAIVTQRGWDTYKASTVASLRKDENAPMFKGARNRVKRMRHA